MIQLRLYADPDSRQDYEADAVVEGDAYDFARMSSRRIVENAATEFADALDGPRPYLLVLDDHYGTTLTLRWHPIPLPKSEEKHTHLERELRTKINSLVTEWRTTGVLLGDYDTGRSFDPDDFTVKR